MIRILIPAIALLLFAACSPAADVTLQWDPSPSPDVVYRLYRNGTMIEVGAVLEYSITLTEKTAFYVTAFDPESQLESIPSNTVTWYPRPKPPTLLRLTVTLDPDAPANAEAIDHLAEKVRAILATEKSQ